MSIELVHVAKPGEGAHRGREPFRLIAVPGPSLARAFEAAVGPHVERIEAGLGGDVLGNRARRGHRVLLAPWRPARARFEAVARALAARAAAVTLTDVRRCYGSIRPDVLEARLRALGVPTAAVLRVLDRFERAGVPGLPVGPAPSAILANAVLAHVDRAIRTPGVRHVRWVDDFVIAAGSRLASAAARSRAVEALGELGLTTAPEKTRVLTEVELRAGRLLAAMRCSPAGGAAPL